jgi:subtilisin-like proprotein convertase family protein
MKSNRVIAVAAFAGCACSAMAQEFVPVAGVQRISPVALIHNGQVYPLGGGPVQDDVQYIYENGVNATAGFFTNTVLPRRGVDDVSFSPGPGAGAGRLVTSMEVSFATIATVVNLTRDVEVEVELWNNFDTANPPTQNPLLSGSAGGFRLVFQAPAAGWANNTIYISNPVDLTTLPGGGILTADDAIGMEYRYYAPGGSGNTGLNTDFQLGYWDFNGGLPSVGSSANFFYRDVNGNGIYESGEARQFTAPAMGNFVVSLTADVAPAVTGACCLPDGTCVVAGQVGCFNQNGMYAGDNSTCAAGNCAATGACCDNSGACVIANIATCVRTNNGIFRGAGATCAAAACPSFFSALPFLSIPDGTATGCGAPATSDIVVPAAGAFTLGGADASVFLTHTWQGDLKITLTHVNTGTNVVILNQPPAGTGTFGADNFGFTSNGSDMFRMIDSAPANYGAPYVFGNGIDNVRGPWKPANPLSVFAGESSAGTWRLTVEDCGAADVGTLQFWQLGMQRPFGNTCYANCDNSTTAPILNVGDFTCFLQRFAAGDAYANCDNSTTPPVLNVGDFTCFLQRFAAGCP